MQEWDMGERTQRNFSYLPKLLTVLKERMHTHKSTSAWTYKLTALDSAHAHTSHKQRNARPPQLARWNVEDGDVPQAELVATIGGSRLRCPPPAAHRRLWNLCVVWRTGTRKSSRHWGAKARTGHAARRYRARSVRGVRGVRADSGAMRVVGHARMHRARMHRARMHRAAHGPAEARARS